MQDKKIWALQKNVAVFVNDTFLGDDDALQKYIALRFQFSVYKNWYEIGKCHLVDYIKNVTEKSVMHKCWLITFNYMCIFSDSWYI